MSADDRTLGVIEAKEVLTLTRTDLIQRARYAIAARRMQLNESVVSYSIDPADAAYLRSAMDRDYKLGHPHCYIHCIQFDNAIMRGKYILSCDGYRLHCVIAPDKALGSYLLWENELYAMPKDEVGKLPDYAGFMKHADLNFMSKARLTASRDLSESIFYIAEKKGFPMITVSAGHDKIVKASNSDEGHSLPCTLHYDYLRDARTDQDCTLLFGYDDNDPVYAIDRRLRIAVISPVNIRRGRTLNRNGWIEEMQAHKTRLAQIAASFYDWRNGHWITETISEFLKSLEFDDLDWIKRPAACREMRFYVKGEITTLWKDYHYKRWEPPMNEPIEKVAISDGDLEEAIWDLTLKVKADLAAA